ncbi:hypothetical protein LQW54_001352 [Pestalotiopsis sp. IQ-011]
MTAIRKVIISEFGNADVVKVIDDTCPAPPARHVQIATEYSSFNGGDINMRMGIYPLQRKAPLTPGYCLVGTVRAVGKGCEIIRPGDVVAVLTKYDAQAELVNQPEKYCIKVPEGVDHKQAATLPCDWNVAYGLVMQAAKVTQGQKVFIHGMSGAVGTGLMTLSRLQGAQVYGTASEHNHEAVRKYGATPFVYTDQAWTGKMQELGGADVVFDPLGFESFDESYSILGPRGLLVAYGNNKNSLGNGTVRNPMLPIVKLLARNINFSGKRATFYGIFRDSSTYIPNVTALLDMVKAGTITVPIKSVWDMEDIQTAHRNWGRGTGIGCQLVKIGNDERGLV